VTTALAGKANTTHSHVIADTTGLQTALDGKAPTSHTHTIANVTGLQTVLDAANRSEYVTVGFSAADYICDGTDDHVQIQQALDFCAANNRTLFIKAGDYRINATLEVQSSVVADNHALIQVMSVIPSIVNFGSSSLMRQRIWSGGTLNGRFLADDGIWVRNFKNIRINNLTIRNQQRYGIRVGDPALEGVTHTYECNIVDTNVWRDSTTIPVGSTGLFIEGNATDGVFSNMVLQGQDIGVEVESGGNFFENIHPWASTEITGMSVAFVDRNARNMWTGLSGDSALEYQMICYDKYTQISNSRFFTNNTDDTAYGIWFVDETPHATILGCHFEGSDDTHRLKQDILCHVNADINVIGCHCLNVITRNTTANTGIVMYNTANESPVDTPTPEKATFGWTGGLLRLNIEQNKSFQVRGAGGASALTVSGNSAPWFEFNRSSGTGGSETVSFRNTTGGGLTASSGTQNFLGINNFINQSGTAGFTSLLVNTVLEAVGSGLKFLIDLQVGGLSRFRVDTNGNGTFSGSVTAQTSLTSGVSGTTRGSLTLQNESGQPTLMIDGFTSGTATISTVSGVDRTLNITNTGAGRMNVSVEGDLTVADEAYDATAWNGSLEVPTKNAIRDKIESMGGGGPTYSQILSITSLRV
jgi:hypothetical protein